MSPKLYHTVDPAKTTRLDNVALMLGQYLRRRPNITTSLFGCFVFDCLAEDEITHLNSVTPNTSTPKQCCFNVGPASQAVAKH